MIAQAQSYRKLAGAVLVILIGLAAAAPIGCLNVNVDADGLVREYTKALDRVTAEKIARDKAREEGINVQDYTLESRQREDGWWVMFDSASTRVEVRGPAHFTVRVSNDGKAKLMRPE